MFLFSDCCFLLNVVICYVFVFVLGDLSVHGFRQLFDRELLKFSVEIAVVIRQFWYACQKVRGLIDRNEYFTFMNLIYYVLVDTDIEQTEERQACMQQDWEVDSQGRQQTDFTPLQTNNSLLSTTLPCIAMHVALFVLLGFPGLSFPLFHRSLFTLTDIWTNSCSVIEYVSFLSTLLDLITIVEIDELGYEIRTWKPIPFSINKQHWGHQKQRILNEQQRKVRQSKVQRHRLCMLMSRDNYCNCLLIMMFCVMCLFSFFSFCC